MGSPEAERFAQDLAAAMDERVALLGTRAAVDRPLWALRCLGDVPADLAGREEWIRRAGAAAAYREESGYADESEAIGPAPERASPEQRASWNVAFTALGLPDQSREVASASDGELWARRAAFDRDLRWAPPYVAGELREAHLAEDSYRADAILAWHRADAAADDAGRDRALREAEGFSALAQEIGAYREALTEVAEARRRWHAATELDRQRAISADAELRRRYPESELPPLHWPADSEGRRAEAEASGPALPDQQVTSGFPLVGDGQADRPLDRQTDGGLFTGRPPGPNPALRPGADRDIRAAVEAARLAEKILAEREQQAVRNGQLDSDDVMRRREAEASMRASAVRQDPVPSRSALSLEEPEAELEAGL